MSSYRDCGACLQRLIDNGFVKYLLGDIEPTEKARVLLSHAGHLELADIGKYITQIDEADALAEKPQTHKACNEGFMRNWLHPLILSLITDKKSFASKVSATPARNAATTG